MDILTVKNMPAKSKLHPNGVPAREIVDGALADLGYERVSYGHWKHATMRYFILWRQCHWWFSGARGLGQTSGGKCSFAGGSGCPVTKFKFW